MKVDHGGSLQAVQFVTEKPALSVIVSGQFVAERLHAVSSAEAKSRRTYIQK
jgi:hypothetical protein